MKETTGYIIKIQENFTIVTITSLRFGLQYASREAESCYSNTRNREELERLSWFQQSTTPISRLLWEQSFCKFVSDWERRSPGLLPGLCRPTDVFQLLQGYASKQGDTQLWFFSIPFFFFKMHFRMQFRTTSKLEYLIFLNLWNL